MGLTRARTLLILALPISGLTTGKSHMAKPDDDNRSNQLNPNHDAYWQSRGHDERPGDWDERDED